MYRITNIKAGEEGIGTLAEAAATALLSDDEIAWAIQMHRVCQTESHEIVELHDDEIASRGDAGDASDGDFGERIPVRVFATVADLNAWIEKHLAKARPIAWQDPIVRDAVEADLRAVASRPRLR